MAALVLISTEARAPVRQARVILILWTVFWFWLLNFEENLNFDCYRQSFSILIHFVPCKTILCCSLRRDQGINLFEVKVEKISVIVKNHWIYKQIWKQTFLGHPFVFSSNWRMSEVQNSQVRNEFTSNTYINTTNIELIEVILKLKSLPISNSGDLIW